MSPDCSTDAVAVVVRERAGGAAGDARKTFPNLVAFLFRRKYLSKALRSNLFVSCYCCCRCRCCLHFLLFHLCAFTNLLFDLDLRLSKNAQMDSWHHRGYNVVVMVVVVCSINN